jgi:hypothetical protein
MTKISFDLDFNKDSETLLREIQDQAKAEVEKREGKERAKAHLSNLHETVNDKIGTTYGSVTELVRALSEYSSPAMRERISGSRVGGRRKTISMNRELYEQIKEALAKPSPNKAAIARGANVSVVQVRKVANGGYDEKFEGTSVGSVASDSKPVSLLTELTPVTLPVEDGLRVLLPDPSLDSDRTDSDHENVLLPTKLTTDGNTTPEKPDTSALTHSPPAFESGEGHAPRPPAPAAGSEAGAASSSAIGKKLGLKPVVPPSNSTFKSSESSGASLKPTTNITRPPMAPKSLPPAPDA